MYVVQWYEIEEVRLQHRPRDLGTSHGNPMYQIVQWDEMDVYQWDGVDRVIAVQAICMGLCMGHSLDTPCVYTG